MDVSPIEGARWRSPRRRAAVRTRSPPQQDFPPLRASLAISANEVALARGSATDITPQEEREIACSHARADLGARARARLPERDREPRREPDRDRGRRGTRPPVRDEQGLRTDPR